jgi:lysophospholipase L1-like esterase
MIVRPDLWASQTRIRLSNAMGTQPVTFDGVFVGLHQASSALVAGTNQAVQFGGKNSVTVAPGASAWSDPATLRFVNPGSVGALAGRKLAVSFHVIGESGPMTWHAKALTSSYVSAPNAGAKGNDEGEAAFPFATASWYFLDAVDMMAPADTRVIVAFGDSITDGTASTINGDDRWPDVLSRRLHAAFGNKLVVVNAGIGGNQVAGPAEYSAQKTFLGGPSAGQRLERDVLSLSGVTSMIWLEGINDFSKNGNRDASVVKAEMKAIIERVRAQRPNLKIIGATVTSALGSTSAAHGFAEQDAKRQSLNDFIRNSGQFDAVIDFDKAILDPQTGGMRAEFVPDNTLGGAGDKLHPNRLGYLVMGLSIDLNMLLK